MNSANSRTHKLLWLLPFSALVSACTVGPDYQRPTLNIPEAYKEADAGGARWQAATPLPADAESAWWTLYGDATLNTLMDTLNRQNLSIAKAQAQYRAAAASLQQAQAGLLPTLGTTASFNRAQSGNTAALALNASWIPDLWGGSRRQIEADNATAQEQAAVLAAARLAAQAQLAGAYLQLVSTDQQIALTQQSAADSEQLLQLTKNQYAVGMVSQSAIESANTQLKNVQVQLAALKLSRSQLEHAIAAALGEPPAHFSLPETHATPKLPEIPATLPSTLLQRRPDIAQAERAVAAANAKIGVAVAASYPSLTLGAGGGYRGSNLAELISLPHLVWSLGPQLALSLFDGGARQAAAAQARANYDASVAAYRQTVINAFQSVEDNLAAQRQLAEEARLQSEALESARKSEKIVINQYKVGVASYLQVLTARNTRLSAESTYWNLRNSRYSASVNLITALGGHFEPAPAAEKRAP